MMDKFPNVDVSFKEIHGLLYAPIKLQLLLTAIELKIFNHLSAPTSAEKVAEIIDGHVQNTAILLDGLTGIDLVKKHNGLYQNTAEAEMFLVEDKPTYLGKEFSRQGYCEPDRFKDLTKLVLNGPPSSSKVKEYNASDEMSAEDVLSYVNIEKAGRGQGIADIASSLPEFPSFSRMLDLGCGPGLNGAAIIDAHPNMTGVAFDRPDTIKITAKAIRDIGLDDRIKTIGGDYIQDSIGEGYDLVLTSDTLYYNPENMALVLGKIFNALNPGGVFIAIHPSLTYEYRNSSIYSLSMIYSSLTGNDMGILGHGAIADAILRAGFKSVRSCIVDLDWGPEDLNIARK